MAAKNMKHVAKTIDIAFGRPYSGAATFAVIR